MKLITPSLGLSIWTFVVLIHILILLLALVNIVNSKMEDKSSKTMWIMIVILMPIVGSLFYFTKGKHQKFKS